MNKLKLLLKTKTFFKWAIISFLYFVLTHFIQYFFFRKEISTILSTYAQNAKSIVSSLASLFLISCIAVFIILGISTLASKFLPEEIKTHLRSFKDNVAFYLRMHISRYVIKHWAKILWLAVFLTTLLFLGFIRLFSSESEALNEMNLFGIVLAIVFGLFTIISTFVAITVLHSIRDLVPDYTQAGSWLEKVIKNARYDLLILTENPAFLQVLDPQALRSWLNAMKKQIENHNIKVTFAYINREELINNKFKQWASAVGLQLNDIKNSFLNSYTFNVAKDTHFSEYISLVPLKTSSLPFYIAIADDNRIGMFCHTIIYPYPYNERIKDVRQSVIKGFISYDENIVTALKAVFLKFLQLNAAVYEYQCSGCNRKSYKFDNDILNSITLDNLAEVPLIPCDSNSCEGQMNGQLKELILLEDEAEREKLYTRVTRENWRD